MDTTTKQAAFSAIRSVFIAIGGGFVARGWLTSDQLGTLVIDLTTIGGAIAVAAPMVWGVVQKFQAEQAAKAREQKAAVTGTVTTPPLAKIRHVPAHLS